MYAAGNILSLVDAFFSDFRSPVRYAPPSRSCSRIIKLAYSWQ